MNKLSYCILTIFSIYGFIIKYIENDTKIFVVTYLLLINFAIGKIISKLLDNERFSISKKETLVHELGHYYICKKYKILEPELIDLNTEGQSDGHIIVDGNIEELPPFRFVTFLLGGYIAEKYIVHKVEKFTFVELRRILLLEYEGKKYSDDYLKSLIEIYLDEKVLQNVVREAIDIFESYKEDLLKTAKQYKYKKTINLR